MTAVIGSPFSLLARGGSGLREGDDEEGEDDEGVLQVLLEGSLSSRSLASLMPH